MTMQSERANLVVGLLEKVAGGELEPDEALKKWPDVDLESDDLISASWHDLSHFAADRDIRDRDPDYAAYQKNLLRERATKIREKYGP